MTVAVAIRHNNKIYLGADTAVVCGNKKLTDLTDYSKIVDFKYFYVAFAGYSLIRTALLDMKSSPNRNKVFMKMRDEVDATKFSAYIFDFVSHLLDCSPSHDRDSSDPIGELLIISKSGIYHADEYNSVTRTDSFNAIGSGQDLAKGAFEVLKRKLTPKSSDEDAKKALEDCLLISCKYSLGCSDPIHIEEISCE
jgi:ATP-dependent protease HslVU (ClpYQ) peptidase subunit